jgi:PAS domain S-box-containing protein/putative nucleotidyltransferase with HDIG domain
MTKHDAERWRNFELIANGVLVRNALGEVVYANRAALNMLGLSLDGIRRLNSSNLADTVTLGREPGVICTDDLAQFFAETARVVEGQVIGLKRSGKGISWFLFDTRLNYDATTRQVTEIISTFTDITPIKQTEEALRANAKSCRQLAELSNEGVWVADWNAITKFVNPHLAELLDYTPKEMLGRPIFDFMDEHSVQISKAGFERCRQGVREQLDLRLYHKSGTTIDVIIGLTPVYNESGAGDGILALVIDNMEQKQAQEGLLRINRALKVLSESNQALVRAADEVELIHQICRIVVEVGGYRLAWVGYAEQDARKTIKPAAKFGYDHGYLDSIWVSWDDVPEGRGPAGMAVRTGQVYITHDVQADACFDSVRTKIDDRGYASLIGLPLLDGDHAFGVITIYAQEKDAFDSEEVNLLKELANDLSYGILALRAREDRKRTREALKFSKLALDQTSDAVFWVEESGRFFDVNKAACSSLGYTKEELLSLSVFDINPDFTAENWVEHWNAFPKSHSLFQTRHKTKDGRIFPVEVMGDFIEYNQRVYYCVFIRDISERKRVEEELQLSLGRLRHSIEEAVEAMAMTVEIRDPYTAGHQRRVAQLVQAIATEMGLPQEQIDGVKLAAIVHDIGKIYIPAEILSKPGRISAIEMTMIRTHPQVGYDILKTIEFPWPIADAVRQHHERWDGTGYPNGLVGEESILEARIIGVADVVEAMSSHRPYRPALGITQALQEIEEHRGTVYDPQVVDACLRLFRTQGFSFEE